MSPDLQLEPGDQVKTASEPLSAKDNVSIDLQTSSSSSRSDAASVEFDDDH